METERRTAFDPQPFLDRVGRGRRIEKFGKGEVIFSQDDPADAVFYIQQGKVKIAVDSAEGKEAVVAILGTGDFFGEGCLAGRQRRVTSATAMSDSVIARLNRSAIVGVIRREPAFSEIFIAHLLARTSRIESDLVDQMFNSSEQRLARLLLLLANFYNDEMSESVIAKISQETLAEMIGTTRARVSFFMNKFRRLGFIDYNGTLRVHRSLLDMVLREQPDIGIPQGSDPSAG
jgi:CRP-like cAMP-binding protein